MEELQNQYHTPFYVMKIVRWKLFSSVSPIYYAT